MCATTSRLVVQVEERGDNSNALISLPLPERLPVTDDEDRATVINVSGKDSAVLYFYTLLL